MNHILYWLSKHTLVLFAILIFIVLFFWFMRFQKKLQIYWKEALLMSLLHVAIGWPAMKLMALVEVGFDMEKAANIRLFGAIFTLPFVYWLWAKITKRDMATVMDLSAICVIIGAISGRLNCFTAGCCQGYPSDLLGQMRWPLRELEMIFYFAFIFLYAGKIQKGKTWGQVYPVYMFSYGLLRFLSEFVREEFTTQVGALHLAHIWSLISMGVGAGIYIYISKTQKEVKNRAKARKK